MKKEAERLNGLVATLTTASQQRAQAPAAAANTGGVSSESPWSKVELASQGSSGNDGGAVISRGPAPGPNLCPRCPILDAEIVRLAKDIVALEKEKIKLELEYKQLRANHDEYKTDAKLQRKFDKKKE